MRATARRRSPAYRRLERTVVDVGRNAGAAQAEDRNGTLRLIAANDGKIDVDPGPNVDLRTISLLDFVAYAGPEEGFASGFNDLGQLAFSARFTDGTGGIYKLKRIK